MDSWSILDGKLWLVSCSDSRLIQSMARLCRPMRVPDWLKQDNLYEGLDLDAAPALFVFREFMRVLHQYNRIDEREHKLYYLGGIRSNLLHELFNRRYDERKDLL